MQPHCNKVNLKAAQMFQHDHHECTCATSLSFAHVFCSCGALLMVSEIRTDSKMPVAFGAGDSNVGERAPLRPDV